MKEPPSYPSTKGENILADMHFTGAKISGTSTFHNALRTRSLAPARLEPGGRRHRGSTPTRGPAFGDPFNLTATTAGAGAALSLSDWTAHTDGAAQG
jgi:hypothetical protein